MKLAVARASSRLWLSMMEHSDVEFDDRSEQAWQWP